MTSTNRVPCIVAAIIAAVVGLCLLLAGWGHLSAILKSRAGQPFDYRFVSLLTTSGILMFPGVVAIATSYWLWRGRTWAYTACLLSASALMLYLTLLVYMKTQASEGQTSAGDEVYYVSGIVTAYFIVTLGVFLWLRRDRACQPAAV